MGINSPGNYEFGVILGSNKVNLEELNEFDEFYDREVNTDFGSVFLRDGKNENVVVLPRHGKNSSIPPHKINHNANLLAFKQLGVGKIISFTSVCSLKHELQPGTIIMPDDYINTSSIPTYFDSKIRHIIPGMDTEFRNQIFLKIKELPMTIKFNGIYIQTQGPRLETKAEIQMLKNFGDVIGMTMAAEATLASEQQLSYANISSIDNYCNGIVEEPLTIEAMVENQAKNCENFLKIIKKLLE